MSAMLEIQYRSPVDSNRELRIRERLSALGGRLTHREEPPEDFARAICLTWEFDDFADAERAADKLRSDGEHVEGPCDY